MNKLIKHEFKKRISVKLFIYFAIALILFAIIIGAIFMYLFRDYSMELHKNELSNRASSIASTYGSFVLEEDPNSHSSPGRRQGQAMYTRFINNIAMNDVWIVDINLNIFVGGSRGFDQIAPNDLASDAKTVVENAFLGETTFSEGFSELLNVPTLTVGTPIISNNDIVGAILIHSPVEGIQEGILRGFYMLSISMITALIVAFLISGIMALSFTKPLHKMNKAAILLSRKNYDTKTGVKRKDEIGQLANSIDTLSDRLYESEKESEHLEQLRRDFISNISHELRTPVTVIRGSLEALSDKIVDDPDKVKEYYQQMIGESIFLERLINDLMDLSKLQNPSFKMTSEKVNLIEVLNDVARSARQFAEKKNIKINFHASVPSMEITGDYGRLRQMFMIVLDNAVKFSPTNGSVDIFADNNSIEIRDEGKGIPPEDIPHIFDRFYKTKSSDNLAGTGLGLAIAKEIATRHNFEITAKNSPDKGAIFSFS